MKIRIRNAFFGLMSGLLLLAAGTPSAFAQQCSVSTDFVQVSGGEGHSLAIGPDGSLWSWGSNGAGALGLGDGTTIPWTAIPQQVGTDTDWVTVEAGRLSSLAIKSNGTLWAWGANSIGQLGDGTNNNKSSPVQIGNASWVSLATGYSGTGYNHSLGIQSDGSLWAWGGNSSGRLGIGFSPPDVNIPTRVGLDTNWASIDAGEGFSVGLRTDRTLWAWGANNQGQLGTGIQHQFEYIPKKIGTEQWKSIQAGRVHVLGIQSNGTLWTWGYNQQRQLGENVVTQLSPRQLGTFDDWEAIASGWYHNSGIRVDGTLWVWGNNQQGQLASYSPGDQSVPTKQLGTDNDWESIQAGGWFSFAFKSGSDDRLWGWGRGWYGELGGAPGGVVGPGPVSTPPFPCPVQDTDDDGVNDDVDMCPMTAAGAIVDASGCADYEVDMDGDGICDSGAASSGPSACTGSDNCPLDANFGQEDADSDGAGNACDPDDDNDGVADGSDNCPLTANPLQENSDGVGAGDACNSDGDGDEIDDDVDICPLNPDPDQTDTDGDLAGDACDANDDGDDFNDVDDNCPLDVNNEQEDLDGDNIGDACDADLDGDGVDNIVDNCPITSGGDANQTDTDTDGNGDVCDIDDDNDTVLDGADNCPLAANTSQGDADGDGTGDACNDADDADADEWSDALDNCPGLANGDQADFDGDLIGDVCDTDKDGDGVDNAADNCAATPSDEVSDFSGCTIAQLCPCDGPQGTTSPWKNHGKYVSCVAHAANDFRDAGLIFDSEHGDIVSAAGQSSCGHRN